MGDMNVSGVGKILSTQNATAIGAAKADEDLKVSFSAMMSQTNLSNAKNMASHSANQNAKEIDKAKAPAQTATSDYEKYQYKDNTIQNKPEMEAKDTSQVETKVNEFVEEVKNVIQEELGVTEEEIEKAMESLGFTFPDLLNQNNLANLIVELTGSDNVNQLLCSEMFVTVLQSVNALGQKLLSELEMSVDEVQMVMSELEQTVTKTETQVVDEKVDIQNVVSDENETTTVGENETLAQVVTATESDEEQNLNKPQKTENAQQADTQNQVAASEKVVETSETEEQHANEKQMFTEQEKDSENTDDVAEIKTGKVTFESTVTQVNEQATQTVTINQSTVVNQMGQVETVTVLPENVNVREVINQIVDATRITLNGDMSKIEMQLNPEKLGKMYLEITQHEGAVTAKIQLQNEAVRQAVEAQVAELKQNLNQAGVKVDAVEVTVASHEFERNLEQGTHQEEQQAEEHEKAMKHRRINLNDLDELSGLMSEEEALVAKMMAEQGNSVDFTA